MSEIKTIIAKVNGKDERDLTIKFNDIFRIEYRSGKIEYAIVSLNGINSKGTCKNLYYTITNLCRPAYYTLVELPDQGEWTRKDMEGHIEFIIVFR